MKKEEIVLTDWKRIVLGEAPLEFMLEVFVRTLIVYLILLVAVRIMGKRMTAQMSIYEMAVVILLGAIVSVPMQVPDKGILIGLFILILTVAIHRFINWASFKSRAFERISQGSTTLMVKDGQLRLEEMKKAYISRETLFATLRQNKMQHLGQIKRLYLEEDGSFSLFIADDPSPGLSLIPDSDYNLKSRGAVAEKYFACVSCGKVLGEEHIPDKPCPVCDNRHWTKAIQ